MTGLRPATRTRTAVTGLTDTARRLTLRADRWTRATAAGASAGAASHSSTRGGGRRARLVLSRVHPWSVTRVTLLYSSCLFVILLVVVAVLWSVLYVAGVFDSVKSTAEDLTGNASGGVTDWLSFPRVMLIATLVGLANIVLVTVLSAAASLLYNMCTDNVDGIEVTLGERG